MRTRPYHRPIYLLLAALISPVLVLAHIGRGQQRAIDSASATSPAPAPAAASPDFACLSGGSTIFDASTVPANPHFDDRAVTLGVKFRADVDGFVTGVRFYKDARDTGAHLGELWSGTGLLLASATFTESASGWQEASFATPVAITAGTTYIAANHTTTGYPQDVGYFSATGVDAPPLHALKDGVDGGNGVYGYDVVPGTSAFPDQSFQGSNYYVDVVFATGTGCDDGNPCTEDTCDPISGCVHTNAPDGTACNDGNVCTANDTCGGGTCVGGSGHAGTQSIFGTSTTPANPHYPDRPVTLGVKFRTDVSGFVTGVRFYKDASDAGPHVGELWDRSGALLASAIFTETASGWQQASFATPIPITPGTTYIAANHTVTGYPQDLNYFTANGVDSPPLHALKDGEDGPNGVYAYDADPGTSLFPDQGAFGSNYYVDVVFTSSLDCDDGNPCTDDSCDPIAGCTHTNKADGATCDDGNACTTQDSCSNGTCVGGPPPDCDDGNVCTVDSCNPSTGCVSTPGNAGTVCRAAAGVCDVAETCTGTSAACPDDAKSTAVCRPSAGPCDAAESCDGASNDCPADVLLPATTVCRAAAGVCDPAETCTGTSAACPADAKSTAVCRPAAGPCDTAESCDGASNDCPADVLLPATTVCRAAAGVCDPAETCTGTSAACPADAKSTAVCRPAAGPCDTAESCDGVSNDCPTDVLLPATTVCRAAAGVCDLAETCTGTSAACPADAKSTAVCRPSAGPCDAAESCDGASNDCPADGKQADGTACNDGNACTQGDSCQAGACVGGSAVVCTAADQCHTAGTCDPTSGVCSNPAKPNGSACSDGNACTSGDVCVGGACAGTPAPLVQTTCSISPSTMNVNSSGLSFSIGLTLYDTCSGGPVPIDGSLLGQAYISNAAGTVLPDPSSLTCSDPSDPERGIVDDAATRTVSGNTVTLKFDKPSDGNCNTLDGSRQELLATLAGVPDNTTALVCVDSRVEGAVVHCCMNPRIRNRGTR
jgi:hypothetical protein